MKITTYTPDGSIKEVREHHVQVPNHITSFDPNRSFLTISDEDMMAFDEGDNHRKEMIIDKVLFLLEQDMSNYAKFLLDGRNDLGLRDAALETHLTLEEQRNYSQLLQRFIRRHSSAESKRRFSCEPRLIDEDVMILDLITTILMSELRNNIDRERGNDCFKPVLTQIHWLYYTLKRMSDFDALPPKGIEVMHVLYPFANLKETTPETLLSRIMVEKYIDTLYFSGSKYRCELYRILFVLGYCPKSQQKAIYNSGTFAYDKATEDNNQVITIDTNISDEIENIKIELAKEEFTTLYAECNASDELKSVIQDLLSKQYERYRDVKGEAIVKNTTKKAMRDNHYTDPNDLVRKDWEKLYFDSLNELERKYRVNNCLPYDLDYPLFYYYVLVEECEICMKYDFRGILLEAIVARILQNRNEKKEALYEQMFKLNFIETKAELIKAETLPDEETNDEFELRRERELRKLYEELSNGEDRDIAKKLECGKFKLEDSKDAVKYFMVLLTPIFKYEEYFNRKAKITQNDVREKIEKVLGLKSVCRNLLDDRKKIVIKHNLNIKYVLNIIGYLTEVGKQNYKNIINPRIGFRLEKDLTYLWKLKGAGSYHKYVSGYDNGGTGGLLSDSVKNEIKSIIR